MIRLLAVSPGDGGDLRPWLDGLSAVGWPAVLLREPGCAAVAALVDAARARVPDVLLHDRTPGARALAAARGWPLHLPSGAPPWDGPCSVSTHAEDEVDRWLAAGARFVVWSPVHAPLSKPATVPPLGEERFLRHARGRPVLALGGITPEAVERLVGGGATGVAVLGGLGPHAERAGDYREALERGLREWASRSRPAG